MRLWKIVLGLFLILSITGCGQEPEAARRELTQLGITWNLESFVESVEDSDLVTVRLFLRAGMNPNAASEYGWTPVMHAALRGHTAVARALLDGGSRVNARAEDGFTALSLAAGGGHTDTAKLLIEAGADVNAQEKDGWTALMYAAEGGYREMVKLLIENKANIHAKSADGSTPLSLAEGEGHSEVVDLLRRVGAVNGENVRNSLAIVQVPSRRAL